MPRPSNWLLLIVGLLAGLALDAALFWTKDSFRVLFAAPFGLLALFICYWSLRRSQRRS